MDRSEETVSIDLSAKQECEKVFELYENVLLRVLGVGMWVTFS